MNIKLIEFIFNQSNTGKNTLGLKIEDDNAVQDVSHDINDTTGLNEFSIIKDSNNEIENNLNSQVGDSIIDDVEEGSLANGNCDEDESDEANDEENETDEDEDNQVESELIRGGEQQSGETDQSNPNEEDDEDEEEEEEEGDDEDEEEEEEDEEDGEEEVSEQGNDDDDEMDMNFKCDMSLADIQKELQEIAGRKLFGCVFRSYSNASYTHQLLLAYIQL